MDLFLYLLCAGARTVALNRILTVRFLSDRVKRVQRKDGVNKLNKELCENNNKKVNLERGKKGSAMCVTNSAHSSGKICEPLVMNKG